MKQLDNKIIYLVLLELFYLLAGALAIFVFLEAIHPRIILAYFNINYLLIFWLIIGILILGIKKD